ncbi:hypothetical protein [Enterococcus faecium]|uniref:hypothetical protein n=1 Tax=Enterococcus faecium TaxID=1352 RepID=UPI0020911783|nr:hypothetical protein [Enterococcus faecium]HAP5352321.1 hypothetical protein [Enterococcus faecalis]
MKEYATKMKNKSVNLLKDNHFWRIQGLSVQYFVKYHALYSMEVLLLVLLVAALNEEVGPISNEVSNFVFIQIILQLFVFVKLIMPVFYFVQLAFDISLHRTNRNKICAFLKSCLFAGIVSNSNYLTADFYQDIHGFKDLPVSVVQKLIIYGILYFVMRYSIGKYWDWLGKTIVLKPELTTLEIPVKENYFSSRIELMEEMNRYVTPLAITKEMVRRDSNWAFVSSYGNIIEEEPIVEEKNSVTVQLKYSIIPPIDLIYYKFDKVE